MKIRIFAPYEKDRVVLSQKQNEAMEKLIMLMGMLGEDPCESCRMAMGCGECPEMTERVQEANKGD